MNPDTISEHSSATHIKFRPTVLYKRSAFVSVLFAFIFFLWLSYLGLVRGQQPFGMPVYAISIAIAVVTCIWIFLAVEEVETSDEGLYIDYIVRPDRLIPWSAIREITIAKHRGFTYILYIHTYGLLPVASLQIGYGKSSSKDRVDRLMCAIADAAGLSQSDQSTWSGKHTYTRAHDA